jgi:acetyl esterase/lipase
MMNSLFPLLLLSCLISGISWAQQGQPLELNLWEGNPPGMVTGATPGADDGTGRFRNVGTPGALVYLPEGAAPKEGRIALIVCPGGGYTHLTRLVGADGAVDAFLPKGVAVISLKYRTTPPSTSVDADALEDGKRAVRLVRHRAKEWGINPNKIGMLGWSAGANLSLNVATHFSDGDAGSADPVERESSRPDFVVLLSPWPSKRPVTDFTVPKNAPPAFIASAKDDKTAPVTFAEGIAANYQAAGAEHDLWVVETGGHGAFTIDTPGEGGKWINRFWPWLQKIGIRQ